MIETLTGHFLGSEQTKTRANTSDMQDQQTATPRYQNPLPVLQSPVFFNEIHPVDQDSWLKLWPAAWKIHQACDWSKTKHKFYIHVQHLLSRVMVSCCSPVIREHLEMLQISVKPSSPSQQGAGASSSTTIFCDSH